MRPFTDLPARRRSVRRTGPMLGLVALAVVLLSGCSAEDRPRLAFPSPATEESPRIMLMWQGSWLAAIITGAVVWGLILWSCAFHRKKNETDIPIQTRYNLPIEVLYTVLPFVIIAVLFYFTERDQSILLDEDREEDVVINVVGRQWSWSFNYVNEDVYTAGTPAVRPELVLPVDKIVRFELTSPDVIHSFWVPSFLFKMDVIPGRTNSFELTPNKLGTFAGKCAELCGTDHSRMFFDVRVVPQAEYDRYIADLKRAGNTGQLPRGITDTAADRERAYNITEYNDGESPAGAEPATPHIGEGGH